MLERSKQHGKCSDFGGSQPGNLPGLKSRWRHRQHGTNGAQHALTESLAAPALLQAFSAPDSGYVILSR